MVTGSNMKFLKGLGIGVCSFLLFLSLSIFSLAYMLHATVLSSDFINKQVNKFDTVSLLDEKIKVSDQTKGGISQELKTNLLNTATRLEPALKQQLNAATDSIYNYLRGKSKEPELAAILSNTIASNDFLITFINDVDTVTLVKEIIKENDDQTPGGFSKEFIDSVIATLAKLEPQLKTEVSAAVAPINDYIWGKRPDLSLADVLGNSVMRRDFVTSVVNEVDLASLAKDFVHSQIEEAASQDISEVTEYLNKSMDEIITRLEPWLKQQVIIASGPSLDYILGKSQTISVTISTAPALVIIKEIIKDVFLASPPPEVAGMSRAAQTQYFDDNFAELFDSLPTTFTFDEELLGDVRDNISESLADGEKELTKIRDNISDGLADADKPLADVQKYIGYFQSGFWLLIVFMVVMAGLIFLINRNVKATSRTLGINLCIIGVIDLAGVIVSKVITPTRFIPSSADIPVSVQNFIDSVYKDVNSTALIFTIGVLVIAAMLLTVSFIMKSKPAEA
jgi:hypothetical protein